MDQDLGNCKHEDMGFIFSSRFSGLEESGRDHAMICLECGKIRVAGDRNSQYFNIEFHIVIPEQAEAVARWVKYVSDGETREGADDSI